MKTHVTPKTRKLEHRANRRATRQQASIVQRVRIRYTLVNGRWEVQA